MNRNRSLTICLITAAALGFAFLGFGVRHLSAQQQQAQPTAVAVVNVPLLISQSNAFQNFQTQANTRRQQLQTQAAEREAAIQQMISDLDLVPNANVDERRRQERAIVEARVQLQTWVQIEQQELMQDQRLFLIELYGTIDTTVAAIAQRQGYKLVLFDTPAPDFNELNVDQLLQVIGERRVVYRHDSIDLTAIVLAQMNLDNELQGGQ